MVEQAVADRVFEDSASRTRAFAAAVVVGFAAAAFTYKALRGKDD
jgi:hypothetical protein